MFMNTEYVEFPLKFKILVFEVHEDILRYTIGKGQIAINLLI